MVKSRIQWSSPSTGEQFTFEYEVTRNFEASTVRDVHGKIYAVASSSASSSTGVDGKVATASDGAGEKKQGPQKKRAKGEMEVGYMKGYELRRGADGNKLFHEHAGKKGRKSARFDVLNNCMFPG